MAKAPYFKFYVDDFITGVRLFTTEEIGAYILLLCYQWDNGSVPGDAKSLKKISGISEKKLEKVLKKFHRRDDGDIENLRMTEERKKHLEYCNKLASNGNKGGRPPKNDNQKETKSFSDDNQEESYRLPARVNHIHIQNQIDTNVSNGAPANFRRPAHATLEKCREIFYHLGRPDEAERFFNHYESINWMIHNTPVTNVEALANKWAGNEFSQRRATQGRKMLMLSESGVEVPWTEEQFNTWKANSGEGFTFLKFLD